MNNRELLAQWVFQALEAHGGSAKIIDVSRFVWDHHQRDIEDKGDLLYNWQYELRWGAQILRDKGLATAENGVWSLKKKL